MVMSDVETTELNSSTRKEMQTKSESSKGMSTLEPHDNDVLCGRGGSINTHPGNETFRRFVERRKRVYLTARFKREKRLIASSIVREIRALNPPGRFLTKEKGSDVWTDIGDEKARDKTSQALRENAPTIRKEIEIENDAKRAEMRRQEEAEIRYREAECSARGTYYHYPNAHSGQKMYAPSYDEYDECDQRYNGYHQCPPGGENNAHLSHRDSPYYDDHGPRHIVHHDDRHDDQRNERYSHSYREWPKSNPSYRRPLPPIPSMNAMPASNLRTSSSYSQPRLNEKRSVHFNHDDSYRANDADYREQHGRIMSHSPVQQQRGGMNEKPSLNSLQRFGNHRGDRRQNGQREEYERYDYSMMDDDIDDHWNVGYQEDEDMSEAPSSSKLINSHHQLPQPQQHDLTGNNNAASCSNSRSLSRHVRRKSTTRTNGLVQYEPEDKNSKANLFASFAKSVLSWDSNNNRNQEDDSNFTAQENSNERTRGKVDERKNDVQEMELISIMESMSVDDDPRNQQQGDRKKMRMTSEKSLITTSDRELRTQPQGGEIEKVEPEVEPEVDWSSKVGGCHKWLKENLKVVSMFKNDDEIGIGISPVNSVDTDGFCGNDMYSCAGSIGGASLCNIFDSDMALGDDAPIPLTHIAGNIQSMTVKNSMSERILSQRKHMDQSDMGLLSSTFSQESLPISDIAPASVTEEVSFPDPKPDTIESTASREKSELSFSTTNFTYSWDGRSAK